MTTDNLDDEVIQELINNARNGCVDSQNRLLNGLREYLALVADQQVETQLRPKAGPSDAVQQTMFRISQKLPEFRGSNQAQLLVWAREILSNEVKQLRRSYKSEKRDMCREVSMVSDNSNAANLDPRDQFLTPQSEALAREEADAVKKALQRLPDDYRRIIQLRSWEKLSFAEIGRRLGRSENAVTKLWIRALVKLEETLGEPHE
ncbi:MAG: sigma-70 family RNA polymerase sigma factor [Planctomycetota bacterium]